MASSKSTVVGIRLDHERRAWVEAEAARLGVSVRGLFEGMIDEARAGESPAAAGALEGSDAATPGPVGEPPVEEKAAGTELHDEENGATADSVNTGSSSPAREREGRPTLPGIGAVTGLPCAMIRGAWSITTRLIESSGRCAAKRIGGCVLTRHRGDSSV